MYLNSLLLCAAFLACYAEVDDKLVVGGGMLGLDSDSSPLSETTYAVHEVNDLLSGLRFDPELVDFGTWSVGQAHSQSIMLVNQHANHSVQLKSVSGPTPAFYSSFSEAREIPPMGNTTFNVVFLPRELGAIATDLHVHTSFGRAEIAVRGEGRECPYRLKPLVGIKAPINATLAPEVHMYNPHERPLHILEAYSSVSEYQLEFPYGRQIPPYSAKSIIRVSFKAHTAGNHSAYIRIKIAEQPNDSSDNILVIPVEFEIMPKPSVYARNPVVDFGRVSTCSKDPLRVKLDIHGSGNDNPQSGGDEVKRKPLVGSYQRDIPGLSFDTRDAHVILDPRLFQHSTAVDELLRVRIAHTDVQADEGASATSFTVRVRAEVVKGDLHYDKNLTIFTIGTGNLSVSDFKRTRTLTVRNDFEQSLLLYNVTLLKPVPETELEIIYLVVMMPPVQLAQGESFDLLQLRLLNTSAIFQSKIRIDTNVTAFELPVTSCTGRLHVSTQHDGLQLKTLHSIYNRVLDLGVIPFADMSRHGYIVIRNSNPIAIKIKWEFNSPQNVFFRTQFLGCLSPAKAKANATLQDDLNSFKLCAQLEPGDIAFFKIAIQSYITEPSSGTLKIWTAHEQITTTVKFETSVGELEVAHQHVKFKNCFPGKVCTAVLSIRSTFLHPIHITSISFDQPGLRFKDFNAKGTKIASKTTTKVGRIYFDASTVCGKQCYLGEEDEDVFFDTTVAKSNHLLYFDVGVLRRRTDQYRQIKRQLQSMLLTLRSYDLPPVDLEFAIDIEWPKLVAPAAATTTPPTVEVGRVLRQSVVIQNPTQHALLIDYFLTDPKFARITQSSLPRELIDVSEIASSCFLTDQSVFSFPSDSPPNPSMLPPGGSVSIPIEFQASTPAKHCTLLHIRNNLTLYEAVWLTARAVQSQFRFGNRKPGSTTPLLFELSEQQLESCGSAHSRILIRRSFIARNSGELPIRIEGFLIGGDQLCTGYGFHVHDCVSMELPANSTRKVDISFSTDFTNSRIVRPLVLQTNLSYNVEYFLVAQLPAASLDRCAARLPRPTWESLLGNIAVISLGISFVLVLVASFIDYREIMVRQSTLYATRYKGPVQPTFNLRNISAKLAQESEPMSTMEKASAAASQKHMMGKTGQSNLKRRTPSTATAAAVSAGNKKNKWPAWNMNLLMYKPEVKRSTKMHVDEQETKVPPSQVTPVKMPLTSSPVESKIKKVSPTQTVKQSKKSKQQQMPNSSEKSELMLVSQENLSPKTLITPTLATNTKKDSPTEEHNQRSIVLREQNGAKKLGKTPGRERKTKETITSLAGTSKKSERKSRPRQLNFDSAIPFTSGSAEPVAPDHSKPLKYTTSPWERSSHASFSDVVQTQNGKINNIQLSTANATAASLSNNVLGLSWTGSDGILANNAQLGPIGSKKTPQAPAMSFWDSMSPIIAADTPLIETIGRTRYSYNGVFFPDMEPVNENHFIDVSSSLYELQRDQYRHQQWHTDDVILHQQQQQHQQLMQQHPQQHQQQNAQHQQQQHAQHQQQQHAQQQQQQHAQQRQQQQQQQHQQQRQMQRHQPQQFHTTSWTMSNATSTWSPMNYGGTAWQAPMNSSTIASGIMRPPPGLERTLGNNNIRQMPLQAHNPTLTANTIRQDIVASNEHLVPTNAQFDPFSTISSIWSDNWGQTVGQLRERNATTDNPNHM